MKTVLELYENNEILFTDSRVIINDYIKKGKTKLFNIEVEAEKYAYLKKSYQYTVYNSRGKSVGFAVPS